MARIQEGYVPDIQVAAGNEGDLRAKWTSHALNGYPLWLPDGTYALSQVMPIPDSASVRTITLKGSGRNCIITGSAGCVNDWLIRSDVAAGNKGKTTVVLDGINFQGSADTNEYGALSLANCKVQWGTVWITGSYKDRNADYHGVVEISTGGDPNSAHHIDSLTFIVDSAVKVLMYTKLDVFSIDSLAMNHSTSNGTCGYQVEGKVTIAHCAHYVGNGYTLTNLFHVGVGAVGELIIGRLSSDRSTTGVVTDLLRVTAAGSFISIDSLDDKAGVIGDLFFDATTQAATEIKSFYNGVPMNVVTAAIADGATVAHAMSGRTPAACFVTGTVAGDTVTITAIDGTNVTVAIKKYLAGVLGAGSNQVVYLRYRL